jgi:predicted HTH domain antitoxin
VVLKFYELGRLSLAQAAELADHTKRAFFDALGNYGIPVVDYPVDELASETAW